MDNITEIIFKIKEICREKAIYISCAESITGGLLSYAFTKYPGASTYFKGSVIAYTNEIKTSVLKVKKQTLNKYGAVSKETCVEMSAGALRAFNSQLSIAATGYAGPDAEGEKTGTVFIAVNFKGLAICKKYKFKGTRMQIQKQAVKTALIMTLKQLK